MYSGDTVTGSATAATGSVFLDSNSTVTGGGPTGAQSILTCTVAPVPRVMPTFNYNAANYSPLPHEFSDPTQFIAYLDAGNRTNLSGTFYIQGGGASNAVDLTNQISGDTSIIAAQAPIDAQGGVGAANNNSKVLVLASWYAQPTASLCTTNGGNPGDCAIGFKNNFQLTDNTATLLYASNGPVSFKNNADFVGAVYASNIQLKNNLSLTYDARVQQLIGFGTQTLTAVNWVELPG